MKELLWPLGRAIRAFLEANCVDSTSGERRICGDACRQNRGSGTAPIRKLHDLVQQKLFTHKTEVGCCQIQDAREPGTAADGQELQIWRGLGQPKKIKTSSLASRRNRSAKMPVFINLLR